MPNYPDRSPSNEHEAKARAKSPETELYLLLKFHRLEEYDPYIRIEDDDDFGHSYRIEGDDDQQHYAGSVWLSPIYQMYWIASGRTTNEQGKTAEFHEPNFDTRQNALLYILKKFRDNGFVPHCEWAEWKNTREGEEERICLLCPKVEVRYLEDLGE